MKYNLQGLSDADFEDLVRDLLQEEWGIRLEAFTSGRDRGIDLRYSTPGGKSLIVQCKHYERSGFAKLRSQLAREELPKIRALSPQRYVFATSVGLTPDNKSDLLDLLYPFCRETSDILGREDLENLLARHSRVETSHHKLWLTSVPVLERVLHAATFFQIGMERAEIQQKLSIYVQTPAYEEAVEILDKYNYCIISGIPGIGKTTLAQILLVSFMEAGFEPIVAWHNIKEALALIRPQEHQVIYYDDFLGRSSFGEKLEKNEDQSIMRLLSDVARSSSKKLILTTREYILSQARQQYDRLDAEELEIAKCVVDLRKYTRSNRARILYNHLYFSGLSGAFMQSILDNKLYRKIIDHPNYSPRLIESMTKEIGWRHLNAAEYGREFLANLDNPARIWKSAFENQISADARQLLIVLATLPSPTSDKILEEGFLAVLPHSGLIPGGERTLRFQRALRELDDSFVRTEKIDQMIVIEFHNPSIYDFLLVWLADCRGLCESLLGQMVYFEQVDKLAALDSEGRLYGNDLLVVTDDKALGAAAQRTFESPSGRLERYESVNGEAVVYLQKCSFAQRIARIHAWSVKLNSTSLGKLASDLTADLINEGKLDSERPSHLSQLAGAFYLALDQGGWALEDHSQEIADLMDDALHSFPDLDAWSSWGRVVEQYGSRIGPEKVEYFRGRVKEFCEEEASSVLDNASSSDDVFSGVFQLEELASTWSVDIEDTLAWLRDKASDYSEERDNHRDVRRGDLTSFGGDGVEIENLFDSLRYIERD